MGNCKILCLLVILVCCAAPAAGQVSRVVMQGMVREYKVAQQPDVKAYVWEVFTDPGFSVYASSEDVEVHQRRVGHENEVRVRWRKQGSYYLMVTAIGATGCVNRKVWPFLVEGPARLMASTYCVDNKPWIRWNTQCGQYDPGVVDLSIFDMNGRLVEEKKDVPPTGTLPWPGSDEKAVSFIPGELSVISLSIHFKRVSETEKDTVTLNYPDCSLEKVVAVDDTITLWHGISTSIPILDNDYDTAGNLDSASVTILSYGMKGTLTIDTANGSVDYLPDVCSFGTDSFVYIVSNRQGVASNPATVYVTIELHPTLDSDNDGIPDHLEELDGSLCGTDTDGDGIPNFMDNDDDGDNIWTIDEPDDLNRNGIPDYLENWNSKAVDDQAVTSVEVEVTIAVLENDSATMVPATLRIVSNPSHGYTNIDLKVGNIKYQPDYDFAGIDSFVYVVCDHYAICDTALVTVTVNDVVVAPQLFTPNNDGYNDRYVISGLERYPKNHFVVFNRWGNKVYEKVNYENDWDGTSNSNHKVGRGALPVGVYYFILKYAQNKVLQGGLYLER